MTDSQDTGTRAVALHRQFQGKLAVQSKVSVTSAEELSLVYTPGVAAVSRAIVADPSESFNLTLRGRTVAVISDGSAVLGLGNIGPEAALPVMEGKSLLLKLFADVDSVPLVINTQDPGQIINFVKNIAPSFAAINLEDIAAPNCFIIEDALQEIGIPVFHDDQHGTAIVVSAALRNAAKVVGKNYSDLKVVVVGAGAAGLAVARMLLGLECSRDGCSVVPGAPSVGDVIVVDSKGALNPTRSGMNIYKQVLASLSNKNKKSGSLEAVIVGADAVIGVSQTGLLTRAMIESMATDPIVFAMANPDPEIQPTDARAAGARVVATGRSDFPNQINNVLAFPAIFRAALDARVPTITTQMKHACADAIAALIPNPTVDQIVPNPFFPNLAHTVSTKIIESIVPES